MRIRPAVSIVRLLLLLPLLALGVMIYILTRPITGPFITGAQLELLDDRGNGMVSHVVEGFMDESCTGFVTSTGQSFSIGAQRMRVTFPSGITRTY